MAEIATVKVPSTVRFIRFMWLVIISHRFSKCPLIAM